MDKLKPNEKDQKNQVLSYTWGKYKELAFTSREKKRHITWLRKYVIVFGLAGAFFGLSCQLAGHSIDYCQTHQLSFFCTILRWPNQNLTVDQYIYIRLNDQINEYYRKNVNDYIKKINKAKKSSAIFSMLGIFLGALGFTGWTAGWVAFFTTVTASISGYVYANRFQYLIISYQATCNRLEILKTGGILVIKHSNNAMDLLWIVKKQSQLKMVHGWQS